MVIIIILVLFIVLCFSFYYEIISAKSYYIPFFTFVSSYYFIFYGVFPYYAASNVPHLPYDSDVGIEAILFTLAFVGFQFAGYFLISRYCHFQPRPTSSESTAVLKFVSWTLMAGYFIIHFVLQRYPVPSLPQLENPSWYFAFSTLVFLLLRRQLSRPHIAVLVVAVLAKLSIDLLDGFVTPILFNVLIVLSAALIFKSYRTIILSVLVCISLFGSYGYLKYFSRTIMKGELANIYQFSPELSLRSLKSSFNSMALRSSHLLLTSHVIERTPASVPFDQRNPFVDAIVNHVPRVLWPSKPLEILGNDFGKRYGILHADDVTTSWNLPWTVDFYITLGPVLSVFAIFVIGGIFGIAVRWLSARADPPFWFGVYSATLLPLFYQESNFSVMTGSVFSVLIFLLATYRAAKTILPQLRVWFCAPFRALGG
jgi:hypothetical protein